MKNKTLILLFLYAPFFYGQNLKPLDTNDYKQRQELIDHYKAKHKTFNKSIGKKHKGNVRPYIKKFYVRTQENFIKNINKKRILFDDRFQNYADNLLVNLESKNTDIKLGDIKVFISRHTSPNAINIGSGIIIINLGLFKYLENESQLVSVISHEIGHEYLKHVENNILSKARQSTHGYKKRISKEIKSQKYKRYEKAFSVLKDLIYFEGKKNREQEIEADSIGYKIYNNAKYNPIEFINALKILEKLDTLPHLTVKKDIYKKFFDLPELPFKESWLKKEEFSVYDYSKYKEKINKDSILSHPEIEERIKRLKTNFNISDSLEKLAGESRNKDFLNLKKIAIQEEVANLHYLEKYGLSIYLTLSKLSHNPDSKFYQLWLGKSFAQLYKAKKNYQLNRYVDRLVPNKQDESYQLFLSFIWNLSLDELKAIADYYNKEGT